MYLEIHVDSEEPQVFLIEKSEITLGSIPGNDVVVPIEGISKKHVKISFDQEKWLIADQGSTNGTYVENDRLIPGNKKEIQVNQYFRLGHNVHIALVKNVENNNVVPKPLPKPEPKPASKPRAPSDDDKTRVISLKELKDARNTPKKIAEENFAASLRVKTPKRERAISTKTIVCACIVIVLGFILNKKFTEGNENFNVTVPEKAQNMVKKSSSAADQVGE